jgi:hypothetical protein
MAQVNFKFLANTKGLEKGIKSGQKSLTGFEKTTKKISGSIGKALGGFGIAFGASAIFGQLKQAAIGLEEAQISAAKLANVLDSMGYGKATKRVDAYAESLERSLGIDADVIKATQTKLATFDELAKTADKTGGSFDRATVAALDLAAAGFGTAESNAVQLGKALNDPVKGLSALAKSGVTFTNKEKTKIATLVKSNKVLDAQKIILGAIEKQVGGTAAKGVSSFDKIKLAADRIRDSIGEKVLPLVEKFAGYMTDVVAPAIEDFIKQVSDPKTEVGKNFEKIKTIISDVWQIIQDIAKSQGFKDFLGAAITLALVLLDIAKNIAAAFGSKNDSIKGAALSFNPTAKKTLLTDANIQMAAGALGGKLTAAQIKKARANLSGGADGNPMTPWPFAKGGVVMPTPGGTLAQIGEAGKPEAVIPLDRFGGMFGGNSYTVNVNKANMTGEEIVRQIKKFEIASGRKFVL